MTAMRTPLYDRHVAAGAKLAEFAGFDMPIFYRGIYDEGLTVRNECGVFDVSHMARMAFHADAGNFLQKLVTFDVARLEQGTGAYGLILNDEAGILDDIILFRKKTNDFLLVVNASNHQKILSWIRAHEGAVTDNTHDTAMLAVQGPGAESVLSSFVHIGHDSGALARLPYFACTDANWHGAGHIFLSRTGYTGEDGFEITSSAREGDRIWNDLLSTGKVLPCGLGARDVLRIEAGYSLYGSDMDEKTGPQDAGLGFAVAEGVDFWGGTALKVRPVRRRMIGLDAGDQPSAILRHGYPVFSGGTRVGEVTSGVYSKFLRRSIAFASIDAAVSTDAALEVEVRGRRIPARRVSRRFVTGRVKAR